MHLVVFRPNEKVILRREYLCDCSECLALDFEKCTKNEDATCNLNDEEFSNDAEECEFDEDDGASQSMLYEFIDTPLTVAVLSCHASEPVYLIRVVEKGISKSKIEDRFGHTILEGKYYLNGFYLRTTRSKTLSKLQFTVMKEPVYVMTDEVFETFIEVDENLQCKRSL